jgi:NADP-dependent 3-hydroxy acid dehydrogenase YdfG
MDLRGVVQGIQAGYPIMIRQHSGHIVTSVIALTEIPQ